MSWPKPQKLLASALCAALAAVIALPVRAAVRLEEVSHLVATAAPAGVRGNPKALSAPVEKGLSWLVGRQLPDGAWGQGEESQGMGGGEGLKTVGNVADTGMAALAILRSGSTPAAGRHAQQLQKGVGFVLSEIEASDADSLYVTQVRGTRVQGKIGPYIDTFVSVTLLSEVKGKMPDAASEARVEKALSKVLAKIRKNQQGDGSFAGGGWAPVLSQGMAAKGINRAAQAGAEVDRELLAKTESFAKSQIDKGGFKSGADAGVGLYGAAATAGAMQDSVNTNESREQYVKRMAEQSKSAEERARAKAELDRFANAKDVNAQATAALVGRLADPGFVSGFGSNGGEEFLSYMMVSESLAAKGGGEWEKWDSAMATNLSRVQNGDGSWTGHHCITGRTFCTAAALLVMMADRAPLPDIRRPAAG